MSTEPTIALVPAKKTKAWNPPRIANTEGWQGATCQGLDEIGELVFHPACTNCAWQEETYTGSEALALSEKHCDETGHRIAITYDSLNNFFRSVTP